jgi:hypothetical protein
MGRSGYFSAPPLGDTSIKMIKKKTGNLMPVLDILASFILSSLSPGGRGKGEGG